MISLGCPLHRRATLLGTSSCTFTHKTAVPKRQWDGCLSSGGVYADLDYQCVKNLMRLVTNHPHLALFYIPFTSVGTEIKAVNGLFGAARGHPALRTVIDVMRQRLLLLQNPGRTNTIASTTGTGMFFEALAVFCLVYDNPPIR